MAGRAAVVALVSVAAVGAVACSSARAQEEDEAVAFGTTKEKATRLSDIVLPDGGYGTCQQVVIIGNNCHDPNGFPVACCLYYATPAPSQLQGPGCWEFAPTLVNVQQVGKGYCCEMYTFGYGPTYWVRFEDNTQPCGFCGGETPNENQCCTRDRNIVPKTPITNLDDCPDRVQIKDPAHTTPPCGPAQAGAFKRAIIPQRFGPVPFAPSCIVHDECYSKCGRDKGFCDLQVRELLRNACMDVFAAEIEAMARAGGDPRLLSAALNSCFYAADSYFGAVVSMGKEAYEAAQKEFCKCCE